MPLSGAAWHLLSTRKINKNKGIYQPPPPRTCPFGPACPDLLARTCLLGPACSDLLARTCTQAERPKGRGAVPEARVSPRDSASNHKAVQCTRAAPQALPEPFSPPPPEGPRKAKTTLSDYQAFTAFFNFSCILHFVTHCKSASCIFAFLCVLRRVFECRRNRLCRAYIWVFVNYLIYFVLRECIFTFLNF
jgi:hypothetical protein